MNSIIIKSLEGISRDELYMAFANAFEDYEMQINKDQLDAMLIRRGFRPELSFGAFDNENLIAFTFNGVGQFKGKLTAYDTGTGTTKEYRGKGLAKKIFTHSLPFLKEAGIKQYLLEVLQHNTGAYKLYKGLGFEVTREFSYSIQNVDDLQLSAITLSKDYELKHSIGLDNGFEDFWDFQPSWQNSTDAINRSLDNFNFLGVSHNNTIVGYIVFEPGSGDIAQIAIHKKHRRKGLASSLIKEALTQITTDSVKIINTESACASINGFLESLGVNSQGKQFEMLLEIN
jgi:ribosomal protein S18 acetylase RimI-like enzyme